MTRIRTAPRRVVAGARRRIGRVAAFVGGILEPVRPEVDAAGKVTADGQREAVVLYGLVLLAGAFVAAGFVPLALGVPGGLLVAVGLGFDLRRAR